MAKNAKPRVVAELGRPETAAETAARKAENSRLYRSRKTINNLAFSLLVSVGLMLVIYLMVPRPSSDFADYQVDVKQAAAASGSERPLLIPAVPKTWKAKQASLKNDHGVLVWQIHYTTASNHYATIVQAWQSSGAVSAEWISEKLEKQTPTGVEKIAATDWIVYNHPERHANHVNMRFGLSTQTADETVLVYGTEAPSKLRELAGQLVPSSSAP